MSIHQLYMKENGGKDRKLFWDNRDYLQNVHERYIDTCDVWHISKHKQLYEDDLQHQYMLDSFYAERACMFDTFSDKIVQLQKHFKHNTTLCKYYVHRMHEYMYQTYYYLLKTYVYKCTIYVVD